MDCFTCANRSGGYCIDKHKFTLDNDYCYSHVEIGSHCILVATCIKRNLSNDCKELVTLRRFRDNYISSLPDGKKTIASYYAIAPKVVDVIDKRKNSKDIYSSIFEDLVVPCARFVECNQYAEAYLFLKSSIICLTREYLKSCS